jgi:hypothetical protein
VVFFFRKFCGFRGIANLGNFECFGFFFRELGVGFGVNWAKAITLCTNY